MSFIDLLKKFLGLFASSFTINDSFNINVVKQYFGTDKKVERKKKTKEKKMGCSSGMNPIFCIWLINLYVLTYKALDAIVEICEILSQ